MRKLVKIKPLRRLNFRDLHFNMARNSSLVVALGGLVARLTSTIARLLARKPGTIS